MSSSAFDAPPDGVKGRVIRGAAVTYTAQASKLMVQLVSVVVMSRFLPPADFGIFAMVTPIYGVVLIFQNLGLSQATVQRPQITPAQISALFWINVTIGVFLASLMALLAPAIGWFYGDKRAGTLAFAFAAIIIVSALATQHVALLNRRMRFTYLAALDAAAYILGFLAALLIAATVGNFWALYASPAVGAFVTLAGAWAGIAWRPGFPRWERDIGKTLKLGGGITGFNIFNFIARNADNVLIGHSWGKTQLGLYDRAYKLLIFPLQQLNDPLMRVIMPTLARLQDQPERYRAVYLRALKQLLLVTQPGMVFALATADTLVPFLLGDAWRGAAPIFTWLGLVALQEPMSSTTTWLFVSQGRGQAYFYWGAFNAATSVAAFLIGLPWGPVGVAAVYSMSHLGLRVPVLWWMATRHGPVRLRDLCWTALPYAVASAASFVAIVAVRRFALDDLLSLAVSLVVSYAVGFATLALMPAGRATMHESISLASVLLRRS